jgi:hypothetical protein
MTTSSIEIPRILQQICHPDRTLSVAKGQRRDLQFPCSSTNLSLSHGISGPANKDVNKAK